MPPDLEPASALPAIDMTPVDHPKSPAEEFALKLLTESWIDETGQHDRRVMARLIQEAELAIRADEREPLERQVEELEERLAKLSLYDELRRQGISVGLAQQGLHMARATCEALGLDFETTAPVDITERIQRQDARIASLEAQLASAREEALREAIALACSGVEACEQERAKLLDEEIEHGRCTAAGDECFEQASHVAAAGLALSEFKGKLEALLTSPPKSPSRPTENRCGQCDGTGTDYDVPDSCGTTCDVCRGSGVLPELPPPAAQKEPL